MYVKQGINIIQYLLLAILSRANYNTHKQHILYSETMVRKKKLYRLQLNQLTFSKEIADKSHTYSQRDDFSLVFSKECAMIN